MLGGKIHTAPLTNWTQSSRLRQCGCVLVRSESRVHKAGCLHGGPCRLHGRGEAADISAQKVLLLCFLLNGMGPTHRDVLSHPCCINDSESFVSCLLPRALNSVTLTSVPNLGNIIYTHTYTPLIKSSVLIMIKGASLNTAFQTSAAYFIRICNLIFCQTEQTQLGCSVPWTQPTSDNLMSFAYSHCLACPHLLLKLVYCFNS